MEERDYLLTKNINDTSENLQKVDGVQDGNINNQKMEVKCAKKTNDSNYFLELTYIQK